MIRLPRFLRNNFCLILLTLIYLTSVIYMLPLRNQAYDDDFAYIQSVRTTVRTGHLFITEWSSASLVFLVAWGTLFAKIFGFAPKILHLSVIVLLYIGLVSFFLLLRRIQLENFRALFFTVLLMAFPWVFQFTYTFLADVPYMVVLIISLYFYTTALQNNSRILYIIGSIAAAIALLTRQLGIVIPVAILIMLIYRSILEKKANTQLLIATIAPFVMIIGVYLYWLYQPGNLTIGQFAQASSPVNQSLPYILPFRLGMIRITNDLYIEWLQRIPLFFEQMLVFLSPVLLVFSFNLQVIRQNLRQNYLIILLFVALSLLLIVPYGIGTLDANKFPTEVLAFDVLTPLDWRAHWHIYVLASWFLFLPLFALSSRKILFSCLRRIKKAKITIFNIAVIFGLLLVLALQMAVFVTVFKPRVPLGATLPQQISIYLQAVFSDKGIDVLSQGWLVLVILFLIYITICYLITHFCPRRKATFRPEKGFLILVFLFQLVFLVLIMYFGTGRYVIALVPLFILWIADITREWKISYFRIICVSLIMITFTVSLTRQRYQLGGIVWELGTSIAERGVDGADINGVSWAWIPWWHYEDTLQEAVSKLGGDKYLLNPRQPWRSYRSNSPFAYDIREVPLDFKPSDQLDWNIVVDSGIQNLNFLSQKRFVGIKYPKIE